MGHWSCRCISTSQDGSIEREMEQIGSSVCTMILQWQDEFSCLTWIPGRSRRMLLHIYGPTRCHRTWGESNQPSGCGVTASTKSRRTHVRMGGRTDCTMDRYYFVVTILFLWKRGSGKIALLHVCLHHMAWPFYPETRPTKTYDVITLKIS